ncbi:MAG: glycine betaine ABC transporter substrate-binding protein [Bacteroidales bacterium]|nr:glycine betaine ABC transporter substrate-binding protein [Bacteroidales bacterium]
MKKFILLVLTVSLVLLSVNSFACVGKTLIIGAVNSPNDRLLAQMMAVIINERTGTTVNVEYFEDHKQLFEAVKKREINIFTENTGRALQLIEKEAGSDDDMNYLTVKEEFKSQFHLVLLKPFGTLQSDTGAKSFMDVPVIASGILIDYPALPRVLNKLKGIAQDKGYVKLLAAVESGDKPNQVARDFLKKKRFI